MTVNLTINGNTYPFPVPQDTSWGQIVTNWATAVSAGLLQKTGGLFQLLADVDFGPNYGVVSIYYKSRANNISSTGVLQLAHSDTIGWRNNANSGDLALSVNSSDKLVFNGTVIGSGSVTSVTGTTNRITSTGGTTPVIDISASYVGQSSITTLGTIATGAWNGTVIAGTYGGTGVNNGSSTITIGGNVTFSGAHTFTGTVSADTAVTFPTSGTLVNSAVATLSSLTSIGTIGTGVWQGTTIAVAYGGTGQTSYTDGQLLIGNSSGNTLSKATLTAGSNITITNGHGTITIASSGGGGGITGPVSSTNRAISTWNGTLGAALFDNPLATIDSSGNSSFAGLTVTTNGITSTGTFTNTGALTNTGTLTQTGSVVITGSITSGTWAATTIAANHGGTGQTTYTTGDLLYASGSTTLSKLAIGTSNQLLAVIGGLPTWTDGAPFRPQIIATRCAVPTNNWGNGASSRTDTLVECRRKLFVGPSNVSQIQFAMPGYWVKNDATGEHAFGNSYTLTAALELGDGSAEFPFFFGGQTSANVANAAPIMLTDPLQVNFAANATLYIRQRCAVASSQNDLFPGGATQSATTGESGFVAPNATTQVYSTGAMTTPSGGASFGGPLPMLVIGRPTTPHISVIINGDSISVGNNDTIDNTTGAIGFISRGLTGTLAGGNSVPYQWNGVGGDKLAENTLTTGGRKRASWPYATHLICELSTNDISGGASLASCQALAIAIWQAAKDTLSPYNKPLYVTHTKCMPRTTSKQYVNTAAVAAGGTGYATSSTFNVTIVGGTLNGGATATTVSVTTNSSGVVTTVNSVTNNGGYTSAGKPTTPNSPTGGSGSGLSLTLTFGGWSSAADQTPVSGFAVGGIRDQFNTWLDTQVGGGLLDAVIDPNPYVEDQSNPGCWVTNGTLNYPSTDGVHPNNVLHVAAAASVSAWLTGKTP